MVSKVPYDTKELLSEVSLRLIKEEKREAVAANRNFPVSKVQEYFTEAAVDLGNRIPNEASRLFTAMQVILVRDFHCHPKDPPPMENCRWPCHVNYNNEIYRFLVKGFLMEFSIMIENDGEQPESDKYFYLLFNFPPDHHIYHVQEISQKYVPELGIDNEITNIFRFRELYNVTNIIRTKFFQAVIKQKMKNKPFRIRDLSTFGVKPDLYFEKEGDEDQPSKKRKVADQPLSQFYSELKAKFNENVVYSKAAILFGIIHDILVSHCACKSDIDSNEWSGTPTYNNNIVKLWMPSKLINANETELSVFNFSIIQSPKDYFFNMRSLDTNNVCTQKVVDRLILTFKSEDEKLDDERLDQLICFTSTIINKYICKVFKGTYHSVFSAAEGTSEGESTSSSRNESFSGSVRESDAELI